MALIVLEGSSATYVGKEKGWEHRRNKKMILQKDTRASAAQYSFLFEGEEKVVIVNYESINWIQKQTREDDVPNMKLVRTRVGEWTHAY